MISLPFLSAETAGDPYAALISLGPVGVILFLFIIGKIRTEGEVRRLIEEKEKLREVNERQEEKHNREIAQKDDQINRLTASIMEQAIPTISKSTDLLSRLAPLLQEGRR